MSRKILPIPGVPPHQWHKHQPQGNEEESEQDIMAPDGHSLDTQTESIEPRYSDTPVEPKNKKVPLKQWTTTANDPARLRRLMPGGHAETPRKSINVRTRKPLLMMVQQVLRQRWEPPWTVAVCSIRTSLFPRSGGIRLQPRILSLVQMTASHEL